MKNLLCLFIIIPITCFSQQFDTLTVKNKRIIISNIVNNGNTGEITYDSTFIMTSSGFFLSGKIEDSIWSNGVFGSEGIQDYAPGKYLESSDSVENKFFILNDSEPDFNNNWEYWKEAVQLGASFYDGNNDGIYNPIDLNDNNIWDVNEDRPDILGVYTNWTIYSDKVSTDERIFNGAGQPIGIEIRQSFFSFNDLQNDILSNTIFIRYVIKNVSNYSIIDSVYFGFISDPDVGVSTGELIGTDTTLNSIFGYMRKDDANWDFGSNAPTISFILLQGPIVASNQNDTAFIRKGEILGVKSFEGFKNLNMNSSYIFPRHQLLRYGNMQEALRNVMQGSKNPDGSIVSVKEHWAGNGDDLGSAADTIDPKFMFSGNPITDEGWLNIVYNDWRMLGSTGPFKLEKNKPQEIILALVIGRGNNPLHSVSLVKEYARGVKRFYESNFTDFPVDVKQKAETKIINKFVLEQNYPNPFNPSTTIKYSIPSKAVISNGMGKLKDFSSQNNKNGFAPGNDNVNIKLIIYDILGREVTTLVNEEQKPGTYKVVWDASKYPSGVYFYQLTHGEYFETNKMILLR